MSNISENTKTEKAKMPENVPFAVYDLAQARSERHIKRMWIALLVAIALIVVSNAVWLYAWM